MVKFGLKRYRTGAVKVGVREFREQIARYLESDSPVVVTRRGGSSDAAKRCKVRRILESSRRRPIAWRRHLPA